MKKISLLILAAGALMATTRDADASLNFNGIQLNGLQLNGANTTGATTGASVDGIVLSQGR